MGHSGSREGPKNEHDSAGRYYRLQKTGLVNRVMIVLFVLGKEISKWGNCASLGVYHHRVDRQS